MPVYLRVKRRVHTEILRGVFLSGHSDLNFTGHRLGIASTAVGFVRI